MDQVHKPHNLAAILRNCDAAGVLEAHAVPPGSDPSALDIPATTSAGSSRWVTVRRHRGLPAAVAALRAEGFRVVAAHPVAHARDYRALDLTAPVAFLLGSELRGLSDEGLRLADEYVVIPMHGMVRSLNVSVASALLLFEAMRQREAAGMYDRSRLEPARHRRLLFEWCYPRFARRLRDEGLPYPPMREDGSVDPALLPR
jgi:tRNA (guanosine-2'-O-)-methyltransferase